MLFKQRSLLQGKENEPLFKLSIITDLHIVAEADGDKNYPPIGRRLLWTPRTKLEKFVNHNNTEKGRADCILCLGDIINGDGDLGYDDSFNMFMTEWNKLDATIPKAITAGNHDYSTTIPEMVGSLTKHEYVAEKLGYGSRPMNQGSKFNETFVAEGNGIEIRFINFDTNKTAADTWSISGGYMSVEQLNFIETTIENSEQEIIVLFTHRFRPLMPEEECLKVEQIVADAMAARPELKVSLFFGHEHPYKALQKYPVIGEMRQYNIPAIVDNEIGKSTDVYFNHNGIKYFGDLMWQY